MAFLPESSVMREVRNKQLARADGTNGEWEVEMEIRLYREHPTSQRSGKVVVTRLWDYLQELKEGPKNAAALKKIPESHVISASHDLYAENALMHAHKALALQACLDLGWRRCRQCALEFGFCTVLLVQTCCMPGEHLASSAAEKLSIIARQLTQKGI